MRVISKKTLINFWNKYPEAEQALKAWHDEVTEANWKTPNEVKLQYKSASVVGGSRIVFNIAGNKYRLIVAISYQHSAIYIKFIGTHSEYDRVNALTIG